MRTLAFMLCLLVGLPAFAPVPTCTPEEIARRSCQGPVLGSRVAGERGFHHGVASGSPLHNAVVLWTRYTPEAAEAIVDVQLLLVEARHAEALVSDGVVGEHVKTWAAQTDIEKDWVVKLDVRGLESGTEYVYAFTDGDGRSSPIGFTKTLPAPDAPVAVLHYAFFSCASFAHGYFHAYDVASSLRWLDFWVHVGDYIYEYGESRYPTRGTSAYARSEGLEPRHELVSLTDYRSRYAQYHTDRGLQNLRRRAPLVAIWDDHEMADDAYMYGAANHQEVCVPEQHFDWADEQPMCDHDEGPWRKRTDAAAQAWLEWLPVRASSTRAGVSLADITTVIEYGDLVTVAAYDTRLAARTEQMHFYDLDSASDLLNASEYSIPGTPAHEALLAEAEKLNATLSNPSLEMLGRANRKHLQATFAASARANKPWQILATQMVMGLPLSPNLLLLEPQTDLIGSILAATPEARQAVAKQVFGVTYNLEGWGGFQHERAAVLDLLGRHSNNAVVLSGDMHDAYTFTLSGASGPVAVNLATPGVTAPGAWAVAFKPIAQLLSPDDPYGLMHESFRVSNLYTGLRYINVKDKGFVAVTVTRTEHVADYIMINDGPDSAKEGHAELGDSYMSTPYSTDAAPHFCAASLVTTEGLRGSVARAEVCRAEFNTARPALWDASVPSLHLADGARACECSELGVDPLCSCM